MLIYSPNSPVAGGDVMYGWLEPRTLSYLFFFVSIYFAYKENLNISYIFFTILSYSIWCFNCKFSYLFLRITKEI